MVTWAKPDCVRRSDSSAVVKWCVTYSTAPVGLRLKYVLQVHRESARDNSVNCHTHELIRVANVLLHARQQCQLPHKHTLMDARTDTSLTHICT